MLDESVQTEKQQLLALYQEGEIGRAHVWTPVTL